MVNQPHMLDRFLRVKIVGTRIVQTVQSGNGGLRDLEGRRADNCQRRGQGFGKARRVSKARKRNRARHRKPHSG